MDFERLKLEVYSILRRLYYVERKVIKSIDDDTTILFTDNTNIYFVSCPSGNVLIVLPSVDNMEGKSLTFKKTDNVNVVNIQPIESSTIDGNLTYTLSTQYEVITIIPDGTNWYIISN